MKTIVTFEEWVSGYDVPKTPDELAMLSHAWDRSSGVTRATCILEAQLYPRIHIVQWKGNQLEAYSDGFRDALAQVNKALKGGPYG